MMSTSTGPSGRNAFCVSETSEGNQHYLPYRRCSSCTYMNVVKAEMLLQYTIDTWRMICTCD
jgi:hypothetical protein